MEDTLQLATREKIETDEEEKTFEMKDHKEEKFFGDKREKCEQQWSGSIMCASFWRLYLVFEIRRRFVDEEET